MSFRISHCFSFLIAIAVSLLSFQLGRASESPALQPQPQALQKPELPAARSEAVASDYLNEIAKKAVSAQVLKKRKMGLMSKVTFTKLEKAFRHQRAERHQKAIDAFVEILRGLPNRPEEAAQVWQNLGFALAQKGDPKNAIKALKTSLEFNVLPLGQTLSSLYLISQLHTASEQYSDALRALRSWFRLAEQPSPESRVLYSHVLAQNSLKAEALEQINLAILATQQPAEKWLQFALALNQELGQFQNSIKLLILLTANYPSQPQYWKQLGGTYLSLNEDRKALAALELAYKQGFLTEEAELMNLASLYVYLEAPQKGVKLLETELKNQRIKASQKSYELLAQAHLNAKDRDQSLAVLAKASALSKNGDIEQKIGMVHLGADEWDLAIRAFESSLQKGTSQKAKSFWGLAVAKYQKRDFKSAFKTLTQARAEKVTDKNVLSLLEQVKNELANESLADTSRKL